MAMDNMTPQNQPREEGNVLDSLRGDGGNNPDASDPLETVKSFAMALFTLGVITAGAGAGIEVLSNGLEGGIDIPTPDLALNQPDLNPGPELGQAMSGPAGPTGMAG